jgi:CDP-6-deoxy-D-xylo-4-hexulose-3-dehydrase
MQRLNVLARHTTVKPEAESQLAPVTCAAAAAAKAPKKVWYAPYKFEAYGEEEIAEVVACLRDGWLAPGPRTEEFEQKVAEIFGKKNGVMVNSGSSANMIGLAVLGMKKGDEVITPACTFSTTVAPIEQLGLTPIFCDVEHDTFVPTVDAVCKCITPKTKCLMIPNLAGSKPDWEGLKQRVHVEMNRPDICLFEDSCDTITTTHCTDLAVISFYASHIITAGGMGGVVMFNTPELKEKALQFRDWGRIGNNSEDMSERFGHDVDGIEYDFKFLYGVLGYNMKACEMAAAFGLAQLKKLDRFRALRKRNIARYAENLRKAGANYTIPQNIDAYDWLAMPLLYHDRKGVLRYLESNDVQIRVFFAGNITRHPAYRHYLGNYPGADTVMKDAFLIGAHHGLELEDIDRVCDLLIEYDKKQGKVTAGTAQADEKLRDSVSLDL